MDQVFKAAFLFIVPEADPQDHRVWVRTPKAHLLTIGVSTYDKAVETAKELVEKEGIGLIELCAGFGNVGAARVAEAVNIPVGVVRFDLHPGFGHVSGDKLFK